MTLLSNDMISRLVSLSSQCHLVARQRTMTLGHQLYDFDILEDQKPKTIRQRVHHMKKLHAVSNVHTDFDMPLTKRPNQTRGLLGKQQYIKNSMRSRTERYG